MLNIKHFLLLGFLIFGHWSISLAQVAANRSEDQGLKEIMYKKLRNPTLRFNKKQFDSLFFDYFQKTNRKDVVLSKEEYYNYTVRIGIYSEKLGLLYKQSKDNATQSKKDWLDKNYSDYLQSKK